MLVSTYPPYRGGMGNVAATQARLLTEQKIAVTVLTPSSENIDEEIDGVKVLRRRPLIKYGNAAALDSLTKYIEDSDVVYLHYPFFGTAEQLIKCDKPLVIFYHMDVVGRGLVKWVAKILRGLFWPLLWRRAQCVMFSSEDYAKESLMKKSVAKMNHKMIVPFSVPVPVLSELVQTKQVLFVGGLDKAHYFKGVKNLLAAWVQIEQCEPDAELIIVGDGDCREKYENKAKELNLARVKFEGNVADVGEWYSKARATILPSINRAEAFGLVLLESMANGTAVIASDLPGVSSVVPDKYAKKIAPNNVEAIVDAVTQILAQPKTEAERQYLQNYVKQNYSESVVTKKLIKALCL